MIPKMNTEARFRKRLPMERGNGSQFTPYPALRMASIMSGFSLWMILIAARSPISIRNRIQALAFTVTRRSVRRIFLLQPAERRETYAEIWGIINPLRGAAAESVAAAS